MCGKIFEKLPVGFPSWSSVSDIKYKVTELVSDLLRKTTKNDAMINNNKHTNLVSFDLLHN